MERGRGCGHVFTVGFTFFPPPLISSSDVDREEHLIVTAPVADQDTPLSSDMGQDEPVAPMAGPLEVNIQTLEAEQNENLPDAPGLVPAAPTANETLEMDICTAQFPELSPAPIYLPDTDPVLDVSPAPPQTPEEVLVQSSEPVAGPAPELPEQEPEPESQCNDLSQTEPIQKTKTSKSKPPSLKVNTSVNDHDQTNEEPELPVPMATYKFDPDEIDDSFNPFTSGGSKIPNSPPPCGSSSLPRHEPLGEALPVSEATSAAPAEAEMTEPSSNAKPVLLEFGVDEETVSKPPPKKLGGKKTIRKLTANKQKPKGSEVSVKPAPEPTEPEPDSQPAPEATLSVSDTSAPMNLDDIPIPKAGTYNFDPSQWDDPNFNPFGSNNKMSSSPVLPKGSYSFDPDNFDDSVDPFKPSKTMSTEESSSSSSALQAEKKVAEGGPPAGEKKAAEKKVKQMPKKSKERTIK